MKEKILMTNKSDVEMDCDYMLSSETLIRQEHEKGNGLVSSSLITPDNS
jgi:hypothetical protein